MLCRITMHEAEAEHGALAGATSSTTTVADSCDPCRTAPPGTGRPPIKPPQPRSDQAAAPPPGRPHACRTCGRIARGRHPRAGRLPQRPEAAVLAQPDDRAAVHCWCIGAEAHGAPRCMRRGAVRVVNLAQPGAFSDINALIRVAYVPIYSCNR